jgi:Probable Zinc-ribbon domain
MPNVAAEWHPARNTALTPADIAVYFNRKMWFQCREDSPVSYAVAQFYQNAPGGQAIVVRVPKAGGKAAERDERAHPGRAGPAD